MRREVARRLTDVMKEMDRLLSQIHDLLLDVEDDSERKALARAAFSLAHDAHVNITLVAANQYPEMHPDNVEGGWTYKPSTSPSSPPGRTREQ